MKNTEDGYEQTAELLSLDDHKQTLKILQQLGVCQQHESVRRIEKAGNGNMNLVLRVMTDRQSVIVKQARPWVEKYPTIAAPVDRILAETAFYENVSALPELAAMMPAVIARDKGRKLLVLEDLGAASDYSSLYGPEDSSESRDAVFEQATQWLGMLHQCPSKPDEKFGSDLLRELNHAHMFSIPLSNPPAIELDKVCEGLEQASESLRNDKQLFAAVDRLGEIYLRPDNSHVTVLHGDYYPGSWLSTSEGFRVIDPEFCFFGPPEFDLGVMLAHFIFCKAAADPLTVEQIIEMYRQVNTSELSIPLIKGFAGVELIRRLIGVAQLPLDADLQLRMHWLTVGKKFVEHSS